MSQHQKLIQRFSTKPSDFTWGELKLLLAGFDYAMVANDGSKRKFFNALTGAFIGLHEPHPRKILKRYKINLVLEHLREKGLI